VPQLDSCYAAVTGSIILAEAVSGKHAQAAPETAQPAAVQPPQAVQPIEA